MFKRHICARYGMFSLGQKAKLTELAMVLAMVLASIAEACVGGKAKMVNRAAVWWREKSHLQALRDDIRTMKGTLNLMLGAMHS